jgi:hypothetical protein
MTTIEGRARFECLLAEFCVTESLSELDEAILDHGVDEWPMGRLAKQYGSTPHALHSRKKQLFDQLYTFLSSRGIRSSSDVLCN